MKRYQKILIIASVVVVIVVIAVKVFFLYKIARTPLSAVNEAPARTQNTTVANVVSNTISESPAPTVPEPLPERTVDNAVPFTVQAPLGEWSDQRQEDACEETAALMVVAWARDEKIGTPTQAKQKILAIVTGEEKKYGSARDTGTGDTVQRIFVEQLQYDQVKVVKNITAADIIQELLKGNLVIVPTNGQALHNPHFTAPGPERHNVVVRGWDMTTQEFITNDPGTKFGEGYHYKKDLFFAAIRDYPTGDHAPIIGSAKNMIIISR